MNIARGRSARVSARVIVAGLICLFLAVACAPIRGYPNDPENTDAALSRLVPYFDGTSENAYFALNTPQQRTLKRDEIVYARIRAYDIEFGDFERRLYGDANSVSLGSDLVGLVLAGLTATTGGAAMKSALGAAQAGVIGADTAITRDLYYQRTVPALLAQMEADRLIAKAPIVAGLKLPDTEYPLMRAYTDLEAYKNAGSIPGAINAINRDAADAKDLARAITIQRTSAIAQLQGITSARTELGKLTTDAQFLALAKAMQPFLAFRSPEVQNLVKTLDPNNARLSTNLNAAKKARQVINAWIDNDDVIPANQQQWLAAIAAASTAK